MLPFTESLFNKKQQHSNLQLQIGLQLINPLNYLILCFTGLFLNPAQQLILFSVLVQQIVIGKGCKLFFYLPLNLVPIALGF
jgi:hypothetical protein